MLALAVQAATGQRVANVTWVLGGDSGLPALAGLPGEHALAAITITNAIHLMPHQQVFATARRLLRPGGGLAVIANGTPRWHQPSGWSRALRAGPKQISGQSHRERHDRTFAWASRSEYSCDLSGSRPTVYASNELRAALAEPPYRDRP